MTYTEVTFGLILRVLRRQWKVLLGCTIAFTAVGVISGCIWADELAASPKGGLVDGLLVPDLSTIARDEEYYVNCSNHLSESAVRVENCLTFVLDGGLNAEQRGKLDEMGERFAELKEIYLVPLWQKMADNNIDSAVEEKLAQAEKLLETFVQELQTALVEIARESNLDLFVFYDEKEDGYHIYSENLLPPINEEGTSEYDATALYDKRIVIHHNGYRSEKDAFMVLTLFCFLVGVCVGGFFAVCRQSKAETAQRTEKGNED